MSVDNYFERNYSFKLAQDQSADDLCIMKVEQLNRLLSSFGVTASMERNMLNICIDENMLHNQRTRKAGRKWGIQEACNYAVSANITYGDIRKWKEDGMKASDIAKKLKISRATYYRRMEEAEKKFYPDTRRWYG